MSRSGQAGRTEIQQSRAALCTGAVVLAAVGYWGFHRFGGATGYVRLPL